MQNTELELAPIQPGEPPMKTLAPFDPFRAQVEKLKLTAETLTVTDIKDRAGMQLARTTRLALKEVRVAIEHKRKELGEFHLRETQKINAGAKELKDLIEPLELRLKDQEEFIERETARIAEEKRVTRTAELTPFLSGPISLDLGTMTDEAYANLLSDSRGLHAARVERERKEKEEAEMKAKAEAAERERMRLENERLKKEVEEREAAARKEREEAAAALAKERAEAEARAKEAREKAEADAKRIREEAAERERIAAEKAKAEAEKARKEREAIEAKAKVEREAAEAKAREERLAREKVEKELAAKKAAEEKAAAEKIAAAAAPKKEKLIAFANEVRRLSLPLLAEVGDVKDFANGVERFAKWVETKASTLGEDLL